MLLFFIFFEGNDEDEEVVENEEEDFTNLLIEIGNAVHEFFKLAGLNFMPYFDRLSEVFKLCIVSNHIKIGILLIERINLCRTRMTIAPITLASLCTAT